jgi:hypothetical protein
MTYVAPSTVTTLQTYTSAAHNVIVNDIINLRALANVQMGQMRYTQSIASNTFVAVASGGDTLEVSITPTSTDSKILVTATVFYSYVNATAGRNGILQLRRGADPIVTPLDTPGVRSPAMGVLNMVDNTGGMTSASMKYLDTAGSLSTITYSVYGLRDTDATLYINRSSSDNNGVFRPRGVSTIIAQEIPA